MQLLAHRPQQSDQAPLHSEVNILIGESGLKRSLSRFAADRLKTLHQLIALLRADHPATGQHPGVSDGAIQILLEQGEIESDRSIECLDEGVEPLLETITPGSRCTSGHSSCHWANPQCLQLVRRMSALRAAVGIGRSAETQPPAP